MNSFAILGNPHIEIRVVSFSASEYSFGLPLMLPQCLVSYNVVTEEHSKIEYCEEAQLSPPFATSYVLKYIKNL